MNPLNKTLITLSLVAGLSTWVQATCSTHIDMGNHRITHVADPINSEDVVNRKYLESHMKAYMYETMKTRFIRDDSKELVLDITTNLIWQDDSAAETVMKQWLTTANYIAGNYSDTDGDTAATYCENMTLGGYNDWRMPTKEELFGIVKSSASHPAISGVFHHTASSGYWSSTANDFFYQLTWGVYFDDGSQNGSNKSANHYVRCVRAGQ